MVNKDVIFDLLVMILLFGCANKDKQSTLQSLPLSSDTATSPFTGEVRRGVDEFIQYVERLDLGTPLTKKVFTLYFYNKDGKTYVTMFVLPYYMKEKIKGYMYVNDYTFVYYGEESVGDKYVKKNMLLEYQDTLPGFLDYDKFPIGHYEPYGIEFQIVNPDSLLVVRKGML